MICRSLSEHDVEAIREIRNSGRSWFGDDHPIDENEQHTWWESVRDLPASEFYCLVIEMPTGEIAGYGGWRRRDGYLWVSLAVSTSMRGQGIGTEIYRLLAERAGEPLYAGIRKDNAASLSAAKKAGYRDSDVRPPLIVRDPEEWDILVF